MLMIVGLYDDTHIMKSRNLSKDWRRGWQERPQLCLDYFRILDPAKPQCPIGIMTLNNQSAYSQKFGERSLHDFNGMDHIMAGASNGLSRISIPNDDLS
jgi:hypothetical protein